MPTDLVDERVVSILLITAQVLLAYLAIMWLALVYWTFRDIRKRTTDPVVQSAAVLLTLVFFLPGYWVYLVLRPSETLAERAEENLRATLMAEYGASNSCPSCHERVREDFIVCPSCHLALRESCEGCSHALQASWSLCPFCGKNRANVIGEKSPAAAETPAPAKEPSREPVHA
jgi:hypothetical protein